MVVDIQQQIRTVTRAVKDLLGVESYFTDYTGEISKFIPADQYLHLNPFCLAVKHRYQEHCVKLDLHRVHAILRQGSGPFWKVCHALVAEIVIPIRLHNDLIGCAYFGPFRLGDKGVLGKAYSLHSRTYRPKDLYVYEQSLPVVTSGDMDTYLEIAGMLEARLESLLANVVVAPIQYESRKWVVERFLSLYAGEECRLKDLAKHLCLCESRTGHLIKEEYGITFPQLIARWRLAKAKRLLANTALPVSLVARSCGFSEPGYFYRVFKSYESMTPSQYRKKNNSSGTTDVPLFESV